MDLLNYSLIIAPEGGNPQMFFVRSEEDLVEKYLRTRADRFAYFQWSGGIIPMRNLIGVLRST